MSGHAPCPLLVSICHALIAQSCCPAAAASTSGWFCRSYRQKHTEIIPEGRGSQDTQRWGMLSGSLGCTLTKIQQILFICSAFCNDEEKVSQLRLMMFLNLHLFMRLHYMGCSFWVHRWLVLPPIKIAWSLLLQFLSLPKCLGWSFPWWVHEGFCLFVEEKRIIYGYYSVPMHSQFPFLGWTLAF